MKNYKTLFAILFLSLLSCQAQTSKVVVNMDAATFSDKISKTQKPQILDVRTVEEYVTKHIEHATNLDVSQANFDINVGKLDKTKPVFVYCKAGGRSAKAAKKLSELGFKTVYDLNGGILKWETVGLPTIK